MGWMRCVGCKKITTRLHGTNFCINCTSSPCFAPSFMQLRNDPKCTQTLWNAPKHEFRAQWGGLGRSLRKLQRDFVARTYVLIAPVQYVLQQVSCSYEMIPNAPKYYKTYRNITLGSNGVDRVRPLRKFRCDFVAQTFDLIARVHPVLHRVSCGYEMIPNAPKHYETHQNMSLWSNGVDQVRLLRKITTWLRGTNFRINQFSMFCTNFHALTKRS